MQKSDISQRTNGISEEQVLVRLLPEQVSQKWDYYAQAISTSMHPVVARSSNAMTNILASIMKDSLVVWAYVNEGNIKAIISTHVFTEPVSKSRDLLIYSFSATGHSIGLSEWEYILDRLKAYARTKKCASIIAFSRNKKVVDFLVSRGATANNTLIEVEV